MPNYRRAFVAGGCWFFTVNLLDRRRYLLTENINALREATRITQARHPFTIDAMVVLPDHIHAIWTLPPGTVIRALRFTEPGFDRDVWRQMCEMGWPGLMVSEDHGGSGLGVREFCALTEELGASLMPAGDVS